MYPALFQAMGTRWGQILGSMVQELKREATEVDMLF